MDKTEKKVLSAIKKYIRKHGFSPTYKEVGDEIGLTRGRIGQVVLGLEVMGELKLTKDKIRKIILS